MLTSFWAPLLVPASTISYLTGLSSRTVSDKEGSGMSLKVNTNMEIFYFIEIKSIFNIF